MNKATRYARILLAFIAISWYTVFAQVKKQISHPIPVRASFYAPKFDGRLMANGERFHSNVISAASLQFPLGTRVKITNPKNGITIEAAITDRGPWHTRYGIDLSLAAFTRLGFNREQGWGLVTVEKIDAASKG